MTLRALTDVLERGFAELEMSATTRQVEQLATLAEDLERWGERINLTGYRDAKTIVHRLVLDAAALLGVLPEFSSLADLGSGAGFPGLPMAVLEPDREFVLVEARERRHFFQREMIRRLELGNVRAVRGRFDQLPPERCSGVVAQAVAAPEALADELSRWVLPGGFLVVPGGESPRQTSVSSGAPASHSVAYQVPLGGPSRTAWIARVAPTTA